MEVVPQLPDYFIPWVFQNAIALSESAGQQHPLQSLPSSTGESSSLSATHRHQQAHNTAHRHNRPTFRKTTQERKWFYLY